MKVDGINSTVPFLGRQSSQPKRASLSLAVAGVAALSLGLFFYLAKTGGLSQRLKKANVIKNFGSDKIVFCIGFGSGVSFFSITLYLVHLKDSNELKKRQIEAMRQHLQEVDGNKFGTISSRHFHSAWKEILVAFSIQWNATNNHPELLEKIKEKLQSSVVYSGKGLPQPEEAGANGALTGVLNLLFQGEGNVLLTMPIVRAVMLKRDDNFLKEFRQTVYSALAKASEGTASDEVKEAYIGNLLGFLPFACPELDESFAVPVRTNNRWEKATYRVDKIFSLSPKWFSEMKAYGMKCTEGSAQDLLLFKGTTYPADDGAFASLCSDFTPGFSVGGAAIRYSDKSLRRWLNGKKNVKAMGISLGGALSLLALKFDEVTQAQVYNPAGLYPWDYDKKKIVGKRVRVYIQENDLVSFLGYYPPESERYFVISGADKQRALDAHAAMGWCQPKEVTVIKTGMASENRRLRRHALTAAHLILAPPLIIPVLISMFVLRSFVFMPQKCARSARY